MPPKAKPKAAPTVESPPRNALNPLYDGFWPPRRGTYAGSASTTSQFIDGIMAGMAFERWQEAVRHREEQVGRRLTHNERNALMRTERQDLAEDRQIQSRLLHHRLETRQEQREQQARQTEVNRQGREHTAQVRQQARERAESKYRSAPPETRRAVQELPNQTDVDEARRYAKRKDEQGHLTQPATYVKVARQREQEPRAK
jgi:hypothetical protein